MSTRDDDTALTVRKLMRSLDTVALGTVERGQPEQTPQAGAPYVSLAMVAVDHDLSPLLLLSDLADHTRNIAADQRVSLLFDGTTTAGVRLAAARASVQGRAAPVVDERLRARYLARHPDARHYAGFGDFRLYRVTVLRVHLVAGFGRIRWLDAAGLAAPPAPAALREAEPGIIARMNEEHGDALELLARLAGHAGGDWRMTGLDPEGLDLRRGPATARLWFERAVTDEDEARAALEGLVREARRRPAGSPGGGTASPSPR